MFLKFSDEAQKLLLLSLKEKNNLNDSFIGSEHIFLAALTMKNSFIYDLLNRFNITYNSFLAFFVKKKEDNNSNYFMFTPLINDIFKNLGNSKKNPDINVSDIIIEILNEGSSKVVFVLRKMGVDIKEVLKALNVTNKKKKGIKKGILNDIGVILNEKNKDDILIGRNDEINEIIEILCCKNKNNPILLGDAGVGKTAIIEELARRVESGNVPFKLKNKKIVSVSMSSLVAGTKYRGEFEEKINKLILEVENNEDIILFIDEIHTLVGAGGADGAIDASNILKPSLARGNIKIIGATTKEEYNKYFSGDKALSRRFRVVLCEEPDSLKTKNILLGIKGVYEKYHGVVISDEIIEKVVDYADKYIKNKKFPDKAIDILDEVCVLASFEKNKEYEELFNLDKKINEIIKLKSQSLLMGDYKMAMEYSHEEKEIQGIISKYQLKLYKNRKSIEVNDKILLKVMERKTNIPFYTYKYEYKNLNNKLINYKKKSIFSDDISNKITNYTLNLYSSLVGLNINNSLWISSSNDNLNNYFISNYINCFFKKCNLVNIDINNYRNIDDLLRYEDINNKNSLINRIKLYPFSVIVINNYSNADYTVRDFFERINKYGYYLDKNNEKIDFSNSLIIYSVLEKDSLGFNDKENSLVDYNYINIDSICINKLYKIIKDRCKANRVNVNNSIIKQISNEIVNNYDNLNNIDYFIQKFSNKNRTMKV